MYAGSFGTLITLIACDRGIIICGDNKCHDGKDEFGSIEEKIFLHGVKGEERTIYAAAGLATWGNGDRHWSAAQTIKAYLDAGGLEDIDDGEIFGAMVAKNLGTFLEPLPSTAWPKNSRPSDRCILDALFINSSDRGLLGEQISIFCDADRRRVWSEGKPYRPQTNKQDRIQVLGVRDIYTGLLEGNDIQLAPFIDEPVLKPMLSPERFDQLPSCTEVRLAAIRFIEIGEQVSLTIGKPTQCFLLPGDGIAEPLALTEDGSNSVSGHLEPSGGSPAN